MTPQCYSAHSTCAVYAVEQAELPLGVIMYSHNLMDHLSAKNAVENASGSACLDFSPTFASNVIRIKASLGATTFAASLLAIFLILFSKKYKDPTFRLVIYLMLTDILQAVAMCLALSPITVPSAGLPAEVKNGTVWIDFCAATGFLLMTTMWMGNIVIIWIVVHLLVLGWRLYRSQVIPTVENTVTGTPIYIRCKMNWEIIGLLFLIIAPFVIGVIPFFLPNQMYGIAGLWCWIKMIKDSHSCNVKDSVFAEESLIVPLVFFYGPLILIVFFSLISMFATIVFVCYGAVRRHGRTVVDKHQRRMKEIMIVLAYPMLYCTVCLFLLANRVYTLTHLQDPPYLPLWIAHTVADPVRVLLPAIAFLLHPYVWRDLCVRKKPPTATEGQENADQCNNINGDENSSEENNMEDKLLMTQDGGGNKTNYGTCDENRNLSLLVESK